MDDQTRQAFNDLQAAITNLTASMGNLNDSQRRSTERQNVNTKEIDKDFNNLSRSVNANSQAQNSITVANKKYEESMNSLNAATASAVTGLKNLYATLGDSSRTFGKYSSTVTSFGDALANVLKAFGPLGAVLGGVVKGMTMVAEAALEQADKVTKAYDELAKVGGAGGISTKQILEMGLQAGLMSKDLGKLTGVIRANSKDIAGLGLTASDGMKVFGEITAVGTKTIATYSKLGVSQEDLIKTQADYLALQGASGNSLRAELRDKTKLQKATLEYQDNLLALSNLTGEDVESLKKKQKEAAMELNFMVKNRQDELKIRELTAQGRTQEAKVLQDELDARKKGNTALVQAAPELGKAVREFQATGTTAGEASQAMVRMGLGPAIAEYQKTLKEGGNANEAAAKLTEAYNQAQDRVVKQVGATAGLSAETAKAYGLSAENMQRRVQQEKDQVAAQGAAAAQVEAGKSKADAALDARAKLTALEIEAGTALERFLAKINPLLSGFNPETIAGTVATGAAIAAATWLGGKLLGGIFGKGGGGAMPGVPSTGGVGGGRAATTAAGSGAAAAAGGRAGKVAAGAGRVGGGAAGGRGNVAGTLETLGQGGGGMLENAAKGLAAFANPKVAIGAAAFGAAIVAVGAGIAGATWIMSKALPSLAEGLTSFEKLDGEKLVQAGKGVGALGAGLAVFGVGGAAAGIGSIMSSMGEAITSFFGGKTPIQKLVEFSKLDIDGKKVEENAKAFAAFSAAMAAGGASGVVSGIGEIASAIGGAATKFFEVKPPIEKFIEFSKLDIDGKKVKENADAFVSYSLAMSAGISGIASSVGEIASSIGSAATKFFEAKPPIEKFVEFSKLNIDGKRAKENADAFVSYSLAMSAGISGVASGIGEITSAIGQSVTNFFKVDPPFKKFVEFSQLNIDATKTKNNADAFVAFNKAMATGAAGIAEGFGSIVSALGGAVTNFFKVDPPLKKFVEFSNLNIDSTKTKTNAEAFANFSMAMAKSGLGAASSGLGNLVSGIADGIGKLFGNKDAITKFVEFTKLDVDPDKAEKLGIAFAAYITALQGVTGVAMPAISSSRAAPAATVGGGGAGGSGGGGGTGGSVGGTAGGGASGAASSAAGSSAATASPRQVTPPVARAGAGGKPNDSIEGKVSGGGGPIRQADSGDAAKGPRKKTDGIIVHHTGGRGLQGAISTLKARGLGYHYMVDQDGSVTAFVPDDQKTWHAGTTDKKPELTNSNSVSISLVSKDDTDISPAQLKSGFTLGQELMNKFGVSMVYGHGETSSHKMPTEGKTLSEALRSGKLPERKGAASGAMFTGPKSGYPVTLHGNELVIPDFKIPNMKSAMEQTTKQELPFGSTANSTGAGDNSLMTELFSMMENKFNNLISAVEESNSTQSQILKYSRV